MIRRAHRTALLLGLLALASATPAATIEGLWLTEDGKARTRVERCGENLCATIVWLGRPLDDDGEPRKDAENPDPALRERPVLGLQLLRDVNATPSRKGVWRGRIYDAESGKTYRCTLRLDGEDGLLLRGYVGIKLLGRTTRWTRVTDE